MIELIDLFFFFNDTATTEIYTLSLHDALPISLHTCASPMPVLPAVPSTTVPPGGSSPRRSEEHTSELQSQSNLVCRLLLEKKKTGIHYTTTRLDNSPSPFVYLHHNTPTMHHHR